MTVIVSKKGKILFSITADPETIKLNTPDGCVALDDPPSENSFWLDGAWHEIPEQPHHKCIFSYDKYEWIDPRSFGEIQDEKWQEMKNLRDQLEFGGFEFEGNTYDSDQVSQSRIFGAAISKTNQIWTLADNSTIELTSSKIAELYTALQAHISTLHERGRVARRLIYEATTEDQLKLINL